jgi:putative endonuclease
MKNFSSDDSLFFGKATMSLMRISTGKRGEELAAAYLAEAGYRIIERNYRCLFGEIDIVAEEGETLVFVEVKSRRSDAYGDPQLAVGHEKQKKISRIAMNYLSERRLRHRPARFDVVAVKLLPAGHRIELIRNAFELAFG